MIVLGLNYGPEGDPLAILARKDRAAISAYAQGDDYHDVVKKKLKAVAGYIFETPWRRSESLCRYRAGDGKAAGAEGRHRAGRASTPIWCRANSAPGCSWARSSPRSNCRPTKPEEDHCGNCHACLDICPTKAFPAPYRLDARRCISYLTIENKGPIPREFREAMGNRIYGCDDCLAVCPWNKFASRAAEIKLQAREELQAPPLAVLATLDDAAFRALFRKSPVKRIGRDRFLRNVMIAIGNSGDHGAGQTGALPRWMIPSPLVRGAAVWALSRLLPQEEFAALAEDRAAREEDATVRAEWIRD